MVDGRLSSIRRGAPNGYTLRLTCAAKRVNQTEPKDGLPVATAAEARGCGDEHEIVHQAFHLTVHPECVAVRSRPDITLAVRDGVANHLSADETSSRNEAACRRSPLGCCFSQSLGMVRMPPTVRAIGCGGDALHALAEGVAKGEPPNPIAPVAVQAPNNIACIVDRRRDGVSPNNQRIRLLRKEGSCHATPTGSF